MREVASQLRVVEHRNQGIGILRIIRFGEAVILFLKRLELNGFKTFAHKTEIDFTPGFTAIVGPNGSGKSNLTDAVRYVLGEQSAKTLRAAKQDELIFAGTPQNRPANECQVTVTFDNQERELPIDFTEVAITRRVNRQGDSQYLINKVPCRLRDIQELLMGTGIGPGSFYILGTRQVDMVLSSDPGERRLMLEETAGTNRYRFRRKEAMRRLEQAQQNLLRLHDLQSEVEANALESSKALARYERYRRAQNDLRLNEAKLAWQAYVQDQSSLQEAEREEAQLQESSHKADQQQNELHAQVDELQVLQDGRRAKRDILQQQLADLKAELSFAKASQDGLGRRLQQLESDLVTCGGRAENLQERLAKRLADQQTLEKRLKETQEHVELAQEDYRQIQLQLSHIPLESTGRGQTLRAELQENERRQREQRVELEVLKSERARDSVRLKAAQEELDGLHCEKTEDSDSLEKLSRLRLKYREARERCQEKAEALKREREALKGCKAKRLEQERRRRPLSSRVLELEAVLEERVGMPAAVKSVLNWREPGTVGIVGGLIKVRAGLETALEVALGGRLNDVVVEDRQVASRLIERLKRERAGRVTFWPLDLNRREGEPPSLPTRKGVVGYALELIGFEPKLRPVLQQILGQTLVVESLEAALSLYDRFSSRRPHLVTLQGEFLSGVGALTGGTLRNERGGLLVRTRQLEEARQSLQELDEVLNSCVKREEELNISLNQGELEVVRLNEQERAVKQELDDLELENRRFEREQTRVRDLASRLRTEINELEEHLQRSTELTEVGQRRLEDLAQEWITLNDEISRALNEETKLVDKRSELKLKLEKARLQVEARQGEAAAQERDLRNLQEQVEELNQDLNASRVEMKRLQESQEATLGQGNSLDQSIASKQEILQKNSRELQEAIAFLEAENQRLISLRREQFKAQQEARTLGERLSQARGVCEICRGRFRASAEKWQAYSGIKEEQSQAFEEAGDQESLERELYRLRNYLNNFGSVNLGARQEYERLQARLNELNKQIGDIEQAAGEFKKIIEEMDAALVTRFKKVFAEVNDTFSKMFKDIFGGGWAKLELCNPEDWLESGVDISACPPGKKLQNLNLFSTGERALAAIAFLFSLLTHKPSPVVILDELDAPLDDANVEKIARKLLEFSHASQFLVITHNRKTMEFAQRLYGVTMEEPGISKLLSVELT